MTALAVIGEATHIGVEAHVAVNVGRLIIPLIRGLDDLASLAINEVGNLANHVSQLAGLAVDFPSELVSLDLGDHAILNVDIKLHNLFPFLFFYDTIISFLCFLSTLYLDVRRLSIRFLDTGKRSPI